MVLETYAWRFHRTLLHTWCKKRLTLLMIRSTKSLLMMFRLVPKVSTKIKMKVTPVAVPGFPEAIKMLTFQNVKKMCLYT